MTEGQQGPAQGQECTAQAGAANGMIQQKNKASVPCQKHQPPCPAAFYSPHPSQEREGLGKRGRGESRNSHLDSSTFHAAGTGNKEIRK